MEKQCGEYEALQMQRAKEREIRAIKRELAGYQGVMLGTDDENLLNEAQNKFTLSSKNLKDKEKELQDFAEQTGLKRNNERERVAGFNKSISQKAVKASKTYDNDVTNNDNSSIINNINNINEFYSVLDDNKINELTDFSRNENGITRGQKLNSLLNYDELPTVVSQDEFETLANSSKYGKLYRGVSGNSIEETKQYVNDFKSGNLYAGKGVYGNGTYTAYGESGFNLVKSRYATENGQVMTMLLDNNAKVINYFEIYKMRDEELKMIKDKVPAKFINAMVMDCGYYASIKGYDAIILDKVIAELNNQPYIVILNRGKVIMSE